MQSNHMKSFKFTIVYDLETKVKVLMIIQWNVFGNRSIFERAACFWKETVVLGTQCSYVPWNVCHMKVEDLEYNLLPSTTLRNPSVQKLPTQNFQDYGWVEVTTHYFRKLTTSFVCLFVYLLCTLALYMLLYSYELGGYLGN